MKANQKYHSGYLSFVSPMQLELSPGSIKLIVIFLLNLMEGLKKHKKQIHTTFILANTPCARKDPQQKTNNIYIHIYAIYILYEGFI